MADLTYAEDRRALSTPGGWAGVVRRLHADGSLRTVDTRWAPLREGIGLCGIDRDLSAPPPAERPEVAIVRLPVVDGLRAVVGYELVGDGAVLAGFSADALLALGAGRPVWVSVASDEPPALPRDRVVFQLAPDADPAQARKLAAAGYRLALEGFDGDSALLEHCAIVKVRAAGRDDDELRALIAGPAELGLELVATGVADADELTRCQVLGFSHFQGEFFARPGGKRVAGGGVGSVASLRALSELTASEASFEALERIIGADVGLSIALLRHVNSAFFALPREINTVHEALTLLGTRAVRRWATVVALSTMPGTPDQLVTLALLRARMCELLGAASTEDERDRLFTVGLFSVADALLDAPMEEVLDSLPFSDEIAGALARREGRLGQVLAAVLRYEQGRFPDASEGEPAELAEAYLAALQWADDTGRWLE